LTEKEIKKGLMLASIVEAPYRVFGRRLTRFLPLFKDLKDNLLKADIKITFQTYVSYVFFFPILAFIIAFSITPFLVYFYGATIFFSILLGLVFGIISWAIIFTALYTYPYNIAKTRQRDLEDEMPYLSSHMAVLSQGGLPPERIFKSVSLLGTRGLKSVAAEESKNIVRDVSILGLDVMTAMAKSTKRSPSKKFADLLNGFIAVTRSGGNMTKFFLSSTKELMNSARLAAKQLIDTLGTIAEFYVALMIVFPLLVMIMLTVMGVIGGTVGGLSIMMLMYLVSYIAVPIAALLLLVFLDSIMPPK
jgi:flagellar protein FlaJ